jgi:hypothetical protein
VTNRGGPLVGEELLMLQGIPVDDLIFTKETEDNLKDLAGNAMSTTVVGACVLGALLVGYIALPSNSQDTSAEAVSCLVPRALVAPSDVDLTMKLADYERTSTNLSAALLTVDTWNNLLNNAFLSRRMCVSEGADESIPIHTIVQCKECGHTSSAVNAVPPRRYEKHDYVACDPRAIRLEPATFREAMLTFLPMRVVFSGFELNQPAKPETVNLDVWTAWLDSAKRTLGTTSNSPAEFRFIRLVRTHIWTAIYCSHGKGRLEARVSKGGVTWFLFADSPPKVGASNQQDDLPLARMIVQPRVGMFSLVDGSWELCLPVTTSVTVTIKKVGERVHSWRKRLGLKGKFEREVESEQLQITVESMEGGEINDLKAKIDGLYKLLPDCGGACGSLRRKVDCTEDMFFFLSAGRKSLAKDNAYVIAPTCHRTSYEEFREISLYVDSDYSPVIEIDSPTSDSACVNAFVRGRWIRSETASMMTMVDDAIHLSSPKTVLSVPFSRSGYMTCPVLVSCTVAVSQADDLLTQCKKLGGSTELNLLKSKKVLSNISFATSRMCLPSSMKGGEWITLTLDPGSKGRTCDGELVCRQCAPVKPRLQWTLVIKGNRTSFIPVEDGKEAAVYERSLKARPHPWLFRVNVVDSSDVGTREGVALLCLTIGCNPYSLVQRALGLFPLSTLARNTWIHWHDEACSQVLTDCVFDWRVVPHIERSFTGFPSLTFTSNRQNEQAHQPPNFKKHPLRKEQLRSLNWMLNQEVTDEPFFEVEVAEAVLDGLKWRAEGRAQRPVLVRGGIIADAVGIDMAVTLWFQRLHETHRLFVLLAGWLRKDRCNAGADRFYSANRTRYSKSVS